MMGKKVEEKKFDEKVPRVAINGFGRIGRLVTRAFMSIAYHAKQQGREQMVDIVAINDLSDVDMLANLFEFDSVHGRFPGTVNVDHETNDLILDGDRFRVLAERDPAKLPWKDLGVDYVVESTGFFRTRETMMKHVEAGAKKVVLSAPAGKASDVDITVVRGVNNHEIKPEHVLISNASCTTNCLGPTLKVLDDEFGVEKGTMTTIHSYTNDQRVLDSQHSKLRRSRAAALSMIPTSTGAAKAIGLVMPHLAGKIDGLAVRVPTPNVSLVDLTVTLNKDVTQDQVEQAFRDASDKKTLADGKPNPLYGIIDYEWRSLVSVDFNHNRHSAIIDFPSLMVVDKNHIKALSWYDNEWAYAYRIAELVWELWGVDHPEHKVVIDTKPER